MHKAADPGDTPTEAARGPKSVDWADVRQAYELGSEPVIAIRKRYGLTRYALTSRRLAEGWTARPAVAKPLGLPRVAPAGVDELALRLNKMLAVSLAMLEKRLSDEGVTDANARTLTELCRAEEIMMRSARRKTGKTRETKNQDADYDFRDDPDWLNAELDRRIEHLLGGSAAQGPAGRDGPGEAGLPGGLDEVGKG